MAWQPTDELTQRVALEVLLHGPLGRADIARRLGVAPASLTRISTELIRAGLLVELPDAARRGTGRPSIPLDVASKNHRFAGVKISGTTLMCAVTTLRAEVLAYSEQSLNDHSPEQVIQQVAAMISEASKEHRLEAAGICLGGVVTEDGTVTSAPFLEWTDVPLANLVEGRAQLPVFAANDLEAFTEAQHWFGLGTGHQNFATLTLGAGVGYGCVANGQLLTSADAGVGLVGHWPLDPDGPRCPRGHRGCADAMLTTNAIERRVSEALHRSVSWSEVIHLARGRDAATLRIIEASARSLGRLIAAIANLTAPELVIIGGEGVELASVGRAPMELGIQDHRDPRALPVQAVQTDGGNQSWCRGAAVLAIQGYVLARRHVSSRNPA